MTDISVPNLSENLLESFAIDWWISDREWEKAVEAFHRQPPSWGAETGSDAGLYYLTGNIQLRSHGVLLFPLERLEQLWTQVRERRRARVTGADRRRVPPTPSWEVLARGWSVSLIDFATEIVRAADRTADDTDESSASFHVCGSALAITLARRQSYVVVSSGVFDDISFEVSETAFADGVDRFLNSFAITLADRAPELFEWKALDWLRHRSQ